MATFQYAGVQAGKKINGVISASDPRAAATELRKKKIIVTSIKKGNGLLIPLPPSFVRQQLPIIDQQIELNAMTWLQNFSMILDASVFPLRRGKKACWYAFSRNCLA